MPPPLSMRHRPGPSPLGGSESPTGWDVGDSRPRANDAPFAPWSNTPRFGPRSPRASGWGRSAAVPRWTAGRRLGCRVAVWGRRSESRSCAGQYPQPMCHPRATEGAGPVRGVHRSRDGVNRSGFAFHAPARHRSNPGRTPTGAPPSGCSGPHRSALRRGRGLAPAGLDAAGCPASTRQDRTERNPSQRLAGSVSPERTMRAGRHISAGTKPVPPPLLSSTGRAAQVANLPGRRNPGPHARVPTGGRTKPRVRKEMPGRSRSARLRGSNEPARHLTRAPLGTVQTSGEEPTGATPQSEGVAAGHAGRLSDAVAVAPAGSPDAAGVPASPSG